MKLTRSRINRYLALQKNINKYLLKLKSKDQDIVYKWSQIIGDAISVENKLRELQTTLLEKEGKVEEKKND